MKDARQFWISRHSESVNADKLTHIVLCEHYPDKNPLHVIEAAPVLARIEELEKNLDELTEAYQSLQSGMQIKKLEAQLKLCKEQRDLYLRYANHEQRKYEFDKELEEILK